ncbi:hypothetical protein [Kaarinaea lacus]
MKWFIKVVAALIIMAFLLNPETVQLAVFIDAIGIELFILLMEVQIVALTIPLYQHAIKPAIFFFLGFSANPFYLPTMQELKTNPELLGFAVPPGAILMFALFCGVVIYSVSVAIN